MILRRNAEALAAADNAAAIFPDSARVHGVRGGILYGLHRRQEAEQEWLQSLALSPADSAGNAGDLAIVQLRMDGAVIPAAIASDGRPFPAKWRMARTGRNLWYQIEAAR